MTEDAKRIAEALQDAYEKRKNSSEAMTELRMELLKGSGFDRARAFSWEAADAAAEVLKEHAAEIVGSEYGYGAVKDMLMRLYGNVAEVAEAAQKFENEAAGIGMNAARPPVNGNRASGLANRIANADTAEDAGRNASAMIRNFAESAVNDTIETNAVLQNRAGLRPRVSRTGGWKCCAWCENLEGIYDYGKQPREFFQQHENCTCTIKYIGNGAKYRVNGVWNKGVGVGQKGWGAENGAAAVSGKALEERLLQIERNLGIDYRRTD